MKTKRLFVRNPDKEMRTMGSEGSKKKTRLRELVNENFLNLLEDKINPRLKKVEDIVASDMKTQSDNIHTLQETLGQVINDIKLQSYNIDLTMMAVIEVLTENNVGIGNFQEKIGSKKMEMDKKIREELEAAKKAEQSTESVSNEQA